MLVSRDCGLLEEFSENSMFGVKFWIPEVKHHMMSALCVCKYICISTVCSYWLKFSWNHVYDGISTVLQEYQNIVDAEWTILYNKLQKLHDGGVKIVLSKLPIGDVATQWFADRYVGKLWKLCAEQYCSKWAQRNLSQFKILLWHLIVTSFIACVVYFSWY